MEILLNLNWIDIFIVCVLVWVIYSGYKNGFIVEFFKVLSTVCATFIVLHYFSGLGSAWSDRLHLSRSLLDFFSFGVLWALVTVIFKFIREGLMLLLRIESHPALDRWGGLILALGRSVLVCSLWLVFLNISGHEYLQRNVKNSVSRSYVMNLAPKIYQATYDGLVSKFFPGEKLNADAFRTPGSPSSEAPAK